MKSVITVSIHGPARTSVTNIAISFGMNDKVISFIWVAAWKMLTISPTTSAATNIGADTSNITSTAWRPSSTTLAGLMARPPWSQVREVVRNSSTRLRCNA